MTTWTLSLLAMFCVAPAAPADALRIDQMRPTLGLLGPALPADHAFVPGDVVTVTFDVSGLKLDSEGRCRFTTAVQVEDSQGKVCYVDTTESPTVGCLQNVNRLRQAVQVTLGLDQAPGKYKMILTVTDSQSKAKTSGTFQFTVTQPAFSLVRTQMYADPTSRQPSACVGVVGQTLSISTVAVGFQFASGNKEGHLSIEMELQGEGGKRLTAKPIQAEFANIPTGTNYLPLRFDVPLQQAGKYLLVIRATDRVTSKTTTLTLPIRVWDGE